MFEERSWNRIETAFKKSPVPYPFVSLSLFTISYLIYIFLSGRVESFVDSQDWDVYTYIVIVSTCSLVAYEPAGVQYFLNNMRDAFKNLESLPESGKNISDLYYQLEERFTKSKLYYILIFLVITPFIIIDPIRGEYYLFSMYEESVTVWSVLLDIFNYATTLLILYSMATILWIIFSISWALNQIGGSYKHFIKIDLFSIDKVGGLRPIKNLILKLVVYQFVTVSLGIITFVTPDEIIYHEIAFLIILFLITVFFFFKGWYVIGKLLNGKREHDTGNINELYQQQHQRLQNVISGKDYWYKEEKLDNILTSMEFLQDEREQVLRASKRAYDVKAIFTFISTSLLPFATTYVLPLITPEGSDRYVLATKFIEFFDQQILTMIIEFLKVL